MKDTNAVVSLDLESTGVDPQHDRITQIAVVRVGQRSTMDPKTSDWTTLVNPERPIPADVTEITGITNELVSDAKPFRFFAKMLAELLTGKTIVGFNCNRFDIPMLAEEFERADVFFDWSSVTVIDVGDLYKILQPRTLSAAALHYLTREHIGAHDALSDAKITGEVFNAMKTKHEELEGKTLLELALMSRYGGRMADPAGKLAWDAQGRLVFNTHRNKGVPVEHEIGYAEWMCRSDFPQATKRFLRTYIDAARDVDSQLFIEEQQDICQDMRSDING